MNEFTVSNSHGDSFYIWNNKFKITNNVIYIINIFHAEESNLLIKKQHRPRAYLTKFSNSYKLTEWLTTYQ